MTEFDRRYWDDLTEKLNSRERDVRLAAVTTLAGHSEIQAVRLLLQGLNDNSSVVRDRIGELLRGKDHPAIVPGLMSLLDSEVFHVRASASEILKSLPVERSYPHVRKALDDDRLDPALRIELIPVVARGDDPSLSELFKVFLGSSDPKVHMAAIEGMIQGGRAWALKLLIDSLDGQESQSRARVIEGLSKSRDEQVLDQLHILLGHPGPAGQAAVEIISRIAHPSSAERVMPLLEDADPDIRYRALALLDVLTPQSIRPLAIRFLFDPVDSNRTLAFGILEKITTDVLMDVAGRFFELNTARTRFERSISAFCPEGFELLAALLSRAEDEAAARFMELLIQQDASRIGPAVVRGVGRVANEYTIGLLKRWMARNELEIDVIRVLGEMKSEEAIVALVEAGASSKQHAEIMSAVILAPVAKIEKQMLQLKPGSRPETDRLVISILARIGSEKALELFARIPPDAPIAPSVFSGVAEIELRSRLRQGGWDSQSFDLTRIYEMAKNKGWTSEEPLRNLLEKIGGVEALKRIVSAARSEIAHCENLESTLKPRLDQVKKIARRDDWRNRWIWINITVVILSAISTAICFVMNWQPKASPYWYGGLAASTLIGGFAGINMKRLSRRAERRTSGKDPEKKLDAIREHLTGLAVQRESAEKRLADAERNLQKHDASAARQQMDRLIETLLSKDSNQNRPS